MSMFEIIKSLEKKRSAFRGDYYESLINYTKNVGNLHSAVIDLNARLLTSEQRLAQKIEKTLREIKMDEEMQRMKHIEEMDNIKNRMEKRKFELLKKEREIEEIKARTPKILKTSKNRKTQNSKSKKNTNKRPNLKGVKIMKKMIQFDGTLWDKNAYLTVVFTLNCEGQKMEQLKKIIENSVLLSDRDSFSLPKNTTSISDNVDRYCDKLEIADNKLILRVIYRATYGSFKPLLSPFDFNYEPPENDFERVKRDKDNLIQQITSLIQELE